MTERRPLYARRLVRSPVTGGAARSTSSVARRRGAWPRPVRPPPLGAAPAAPTVRHRRQLEASVDRLRIAIELEAECDFGDTAPEDRWRRIAFLTHFDGWEEPLREWDAAVARARAAPAALWSRMAARAGQVGLREPPLELGPLIDRLAILTIQRSRSGLLGMPQKLLVQPLCSGYGTDRRIVIYWRASASDSCSARTILTRPTARFSPAASRSCSTSRR
jgi:hypothetical protein